MVKKFIYLCHCICRSLRRHGHSQEKVNRGMILAPLVGIILNLLDARVGTECGQQNDVVGVFASMDCPDAVHCGFQYLLEYNWVSFVCFKPCLSLSLYACITSLSCG
jgi:Kip1 ubiquitination-promoting complex protein 1